MKRFAAAWVLWSLTGVAVAQAPQSVPSAPSQEAIEAPKVQPKHRAEDAAKPEQATKPEPNSTLDTPPIVPSVHPDGRHGESQRKAQESSEEGTEFWPPLSGYRLKITDTLVAGFTALLFFATLALYWATHRLVRGADKTAERQLRAYVGIVDAGIYRVNDSVPFEYHFAFENAGQTPGYDLRTRARICVGSVNESPFNEILESGGASIIVPRGRVHIGGNCAVSDEEIEQILIGESCIYIWGRVDYRDAFGKDRFFSFKSRSGPVMERVVINGAHLWQAMRIQPVKDGYKAN